MLDLYVHPVLRLLIRCAYHLAAVSFRLIDFLYRLALAYLVLQVLA